MKSTLKLYNVEFRPDLNPLVEDLTEYLSDCDRTTFADLQYTKHNLSIVVKIPMDQKWADDFPYNYASIKNETDDNPFYYYIMGTEWAAQNTIALTLGLDTVNTFGQRGDLGHPQNFTDETHIYRQHMDRFYDTGDRDQAGGKLLRRRIDREDEGLGFAPELVSKEQTRDREFGDDQWAVIYQSMTEGSNPEYPLAVMLAPLKEEYDVRITEDEGHDVWHATTTSPGYWYFTNVSNPDGQFTAERANGSSDTYSIGDNKAYYELHLELKDGGLSFAIQAFNEKGKLSDWITGGSLYTKITWLNGRRVYFSTAQQKGKTPQQIEQLTGSQGLNITAGTYRVKTLRDLNHFDSRISKVVRFPYSPIQMSQSKGVIAIPSGWTYDDGFLKWNKQSLPEFMNKSATSFSLNLSDYWYPSSKQSKEIARESKLYSSEFMTWKAVYDSYSLQIPLERFDLSETDPGRITVDFKPTATMGNNMMFRFNFDDFAPFTQTSDYENILLVDRNNEEPLFSSEYVNYLRSGYQYDVAANKIAQAQALSGAIASTVNASFQLVGPVSEVGKAGWSAGYSQAYQNATQGWSGSAFGAGIKAAGKTLVSKGDGVSSLVAQNIAGTVVNAANSWISYNNLKSSQENAMLSKLNSLQMQSIGVVGSGTIDLLEEYNGNKLNILRYEPKTNMKRRLYDYFDFFGYAHDYYEVPVVSSRYWYNYLQCSPVLMEEGIGKYKREWIEDLKTRYELGVSVFHHQEGEWNFDRRWENWETWVITE